MVPAAGPGPDPAVRSARARPAGDQQDVGVDRFGERLVESAGVQLGRTRVEPLDDDNIGSVIDRLPGSDDLLEYGVESTRSELLFQPGGGQRIWRTQRSCGPSQRNRAVGATVGRGLRPRLDEGDVPAPPVQGPNQAE